MADRAVWLSNGGLVALVIRNDTSAASADSAMFTCWASSSARISSIVSAVDVWKASISPDLRPLMRCCCSITGRNSSSSRRLPSASVRQ